MLISDPDEIERRMQLGLSDLEEFGVRPETITYLEKGGVGLYVHDLAGWNEARLLRVPMINASRVQEIKEALHALFSVETVSPC